MRFSSAAAAGLVIAVPFVSVSASTGLIGHDQFAPTGANAPAGTQDQHSGNHARRWGPNGAVSSALAGNHGYKVLYAFPGSPQSQPYGSLIQDSDGNLFGTTLSGGDDFMGSVFKLKPDGILTTLYSFTGKSDGGAPFAGVLSDTTGNLYGTTGDRGADGYGVVFKVAPDRTETILHTFTRGADGGFPYAGLIEDSKGNLYGTASQGGSGTGCGDGGSGVVFKLAPDGTETVLHSFTCGTDGGDPTGALIMDKKSNLYGTTYEGGDSTCGVHGCGAVFKLAPDGTLTTLYNFEDGSDGANPYAALLRGRDRNLYGTAVRGGAGIGCGDQGCGVVFKITPSGAESTFYTFTGGTDGANPWSTLIEDGDGNLYGTAQNGGAGQSGVVFKIAPDGTETVLHAFIGDGEDGDCPIAGLFKGEGVDEMYGTTIGCQAGGDVVFEIKK